MIELKGKIIPNDEVRKLPVGTKLLVHCIDGEDLWLVCILRERGERLYLYDVETKTNLTELDDLDSFCVIYEYNKEDAQRLVKEFHRNPTEKKPRYVFDECSMAILDTGKDKIVCLVDSRRPDLLKAKLKELLNLANR